MNQNKNNSSEYIAVHCKTGDLGFSFIITVGSLPSKNNTKTSSTLPHAHVYIKDKNYESRFLLTNETIPKNLDELKTVDESDMPLSLIASDLIKWINSKPLRSYSKENKTNWDAMKSSWADIQAVSKELLKDLK